MLPMSRGGDNDGDCVKKADWRGLFNSDRSLGNLQYFPPVKKDGKVFVSSPEKDVEEGITKWKTSLVGQFLDKPLPFFLVKKSVAIMWKQYGEIEVFSLENGMYIFRFPDEVTCEEVLEAKLWHVANKPLILRKWQPGMQVLKLTLSTIPVWIKLMHLPMEFWSSNCLSHVASGVGKPLYADKITEEQKRLGNARVLVEINVRSECPKELFISRRNGEIINIEVECPWLPPKCSLCEGFGHAAYACSKKEKKVWIPKGANRNVNNAVRKTGKANLVIPFERIVRKPEITLKLKNKGEEVRLSNSFEAIGKIEMKEGFEEVSKPIPTTFLEVFEKALSSKGKGKAKMGGLSQGVYAESGCSPSKEP